MFHRITLIGFVGQAPQMRYTEEGTPVTNFSVATRQVVSKERVAACPQGWKESLNGKNWELTTWFRVTCWRNLAEAVNQYLEKGSQVFVEVLVRGFRQLAPARHPEPCGEFPVPAVEGLHPAGGASRYPFLGHHLAGGHRDVGDWRALVGVAQLRRLADETDKRNPVEHLTPPE